MIPNILTTVRLILIPIFAYLVLGAKELPAAAMIFVFSGITDIVDGYIARHFHMITNFGKVYDPFVDKLMQLTALICLCISKILPFWLVALVLCKEVTMIITGGILYLKKIVVYSHWYGKATTVILYTIVVVMILWRTIPAFWSTIFFGLLVFSMLFSAFAYLVDIIKHHEEKRVEE